MPRSNCTSAYSDQGLHCLFAELLKLTKEVSRYVFVITTQNICCWYSLEMPLGGTSNDYLQFMFSQVISIYLLKKKKK